MLKDIFWCLIIYLLYRFIFELVVPIAKTVNKMKTSVSQMQEQQEQTAQTNSNTKPQSQKGGTSNTNDEYIDFEEIKD